MAATTNINGWNVGGNNNSFDQRGHFYRAFLDGNVSGMLVKQNSTPNMTVLVEHGSALLNKNTTSASIAEIKSDTSVTIDTANTSNPRIDSVVIYEDTSVAIPTVEANYWQDGAGGRFKIVSLPGTAAASPTALSDANIQSAIGAGKPFARLANITVAANSTTILNSNVDNSVRDELTAAIKDDVFLLAYDAKTVNAANTSSDFNVYQTVSFKAKSGTKVKIEWSGRGQRRAGASGALCYTMLVDGSSIKYGSTAPTANDDDRLAEGISTFCVVTATGETQTAQVSFARVGGSGEHKLLGSSQYPSELLVTRL